MGTALGSVVWRTQASGPREVPKISWMAGRPDALLIRDLARRKLAGLRQESLPMKNSTHLGYWYSIYPREALHRIVLKPIRVFFLNIAHFAFSSICQAGLLCHFTVWIVCGNT